MSQAETSGDWRTLTAEMEAVEPQSTRTVMRRDYDKRLMLVTGRANPALAARIADKLEVELSEVNTKTFDNGEVYCRYAESVRGAGGQRRRARARAAGPRARADPGVGQPGQNRCVDRLSTWRFRR